jgi:hypothetical protein
MRSGSILKKLAILPAILLIGAGCGGLAATQTISPLMFLIPGFGQNGSSKATNSPPVIAVSKPQTEPVRVLAQAN